MKTGVIGLGLIGGSMAVDLRRRGFADYVVGVDNDPLHAEVARNIGLVDEILSLEECCNTCDLIIVAVPADTACKMLSSVLDRIGQNQIVIDVCSTKEAICRVADAHARRCRYVATHPMAGTEYSGPWAAKENMFDGNAVILCDTDLSDKDAVKTVEQLYNTLNMRPIHMNSSAHDMHVAHVSHISHITSFALALTVLDKERDEKHIFDLASGGFASTVRLAKSNKDMWRAIFTQNQENILTVLDNYIEKLYLFRKAIAEDNGAEVEELITEANKIKRILK